jgi:hypothetical protein
MRQSLFVFIISLLVIISFGNSQNVKELKNCPVYHLSPMEDNSPCTSISIFGYQYSGYYSSGAHRFSFFTSDFNFSYFGITTGLLEIEKISYLPNEDAFSANLFFTIPALLFTFAEANIEDTRENRVVDYLRKLFVIPSNVSNFKLHIYEPSRHLSLFTGLNSDFILVKNDFGFTTKSESGIRLKLGSGLCFTFEIIYGKVLLNSFDLDDHPNSLGFSVFTWIDGW